MIDISHLLSHKAQWVTFKYEGDSPSGKTHIWKVLGSSEDDVIGWIRWDGPWRQYVIFTTVAKFNTTCLGEIEAFLLEQNVAHTTQRIAS